MIFVYVAGPYSRPDPVRNTRMAMTVGHSLLNNGFFPYVPHLSHYMNELKYRHYEEWLALDFAWISKCDAVLLIPGESKGAEREVEFAKSLDIPVFNSIQELVTKWPSEGRFVSNAEPSGR